MKRVINGYCHILECLTLLALAGRVVLVFGNVGRRCGFNNGIAVSEELSRWFFVCMTFLGAIVALKKNAYLGSDNLVGRPGPRGQRICLVLSQVLMLYCTWLLLQGGWLQSVINYDGEAPVTGWSMAIVYAAGVVFALSTALILLHQLYRTLSGQLGDDELVMVQESEDLAQRSTTHKQVPAP